MDCVPQAVSIRFEVNVNFRGEKSTPPHHMYVCNLDDTYRLLAVRHSDIRKILRGFLPENR